MNTYQALRVLNVSAESSQEEIRVAYRKMALRLHPDRNSGDGTEFKKITEAYNHLKNSSRSDGGGMHDEAYGRYGRRDNAGTESNGRGGAGRRGEKAGRDAGYEGPDHTGGERGGPGARNRAQWGAGPRDGTIPEQDWSKFTKHVEDEDPDFWKEYERRFWEEYNAKIRSDGRNGEYAKASEPEKQPNIFVDVDKSLCIGCCSCEIIAPDVFEINKESMMNPKSSVINQRGAGINKIMNAAETCPTKAIRVENKDTNERLFPH